MGIRQYNPVTAGRRNASVSDFSELTPGVKPEKSLLRPLRKKGGRNNQGRITMRHRGGGHKQQYRVVDFLRHKDGVPAKVDSIQYDPNRNCRIALLFYVDGEKRYILAPDGLKVGQMIENGPEALPTVGNCLPMTRIPLSTQIHAIEFLPGAGAKAGRNRWKGIRPHVRGTAMNPIDHPHGGGEGRTKGGRHPVSPSGVLAKGGSTRKRRKPSNSAIVRRRKSRRYGQLKLK